MSYTPTNWQTGDTITAEKLNNMEQGIAGAVVSFPITYEHDDDSGESRYILHASPEEVSAAFNSGAIVKGDVHYVDPWGGPDRYGTWYLLTPGSYPVFWGTEYMSNNTQENSFMVDASGETMSTDGGYVPT